MRVLSRDPRSVGVDFAFNEETAPRGSNFLGIVGRLRPDVELTELDAEVKTIHHGSPA